MVRATPASRRLAPAWLPLAAKVAVSAVSAVLIVLNVLDAIHARRGKYGQIRNQLPGSLRKGIRQLDPSRPVTNALCNVSAQGDANGIAANLLRDQDDFLAATMAYAQPLGLAEYPYRLSGCGDLDVACRKKPRSFYRDCVWGIAKRPYIA